MDKLITVEYNPGRLVKEKSTSNIELYGCVGEVVEQRYKRALHVYREQELSREVLVRFPLIMANSRITAYYHKKNNLDKPAFMEEGVALPVQDLCFIDKLPVSCYTRRPLHPNGTRFSDLLEASYYHSTYSLDTFLSTIDYLNKEYKRGWVCKREWNKNVGNPKLRSLFIEARFYGIDTVISLYDRKKIDGVVIEVIVRPWPRETDHREGVRLSRFRSDVYMVSNCTEYIEYIDGIELKREKLPLWNEKLIAEYAELLTAKDISRCQGDRDKLRTSNTTIEYKYYSVGSYSPAKKNAQQTG